MNTVIEAVDGQHHIEKLFSPNGALVASGREYREGQHQIALRVAEAFDTGKHGMIEGPTGSGKTFAYLASAIHHSQAKPRKRTVIAVSTNALVDQISHDIPAMAEMMGVQVRHAVMKGRSHYVCQREEDRAPNMMKSLQAPDAERLKKLLAWIKEGHADLSQYEERSNITKLVTISGDECKAVRDSKGKCEYFGDQDKGDEQTCHLYVARQQAMLADIVVTNLDVLMWNYQLDGALLGNFNFVILDEGHEIVSKLRDRFTAERSISVVVKHSEGEHKEVADASRLLDRQIAAYFVSRLPENYRGDEYETLLYPGKEVDAMRHTAERILTLVQNAHKDVESELMLSMIDIVDALKMEDHNRAVSIMAKNLQHNMSIYVRSMPIEVGGLLRASVYSHSKSTIAISATLSPDGTWDYTRRQLGMPDDAITYIAPTPFDFSKCAMLYVPKRMPESWKRDQYNEAASQAASRARVAHRSLRTWLFLPRIPSSSLGNRAWLNNNPPRLV
jgi:ATP-dependent DNA helicase DinG